METKLPIQCLICNLSFSNNLGGQFTIHLQEAHSITLEQYIIIHDYNGILPKCACGLCNETPVFYRGKYLSYALGHNSFHKRKELYIAKYGEPICPVCKEKPVGFCRGEPKKYCSYVCQGKINGFSKPATQETIHKSVIKKYGVDNIMQLPEVRAKLSESLKGRTVIVTEATKIKHSINSKLRWEDPEYRKKIIPALKLACNTPEERKRRSESQTKRMNDPNYIERAFGVLLKGRYSKLHEKTRNQLQLGELGFKSEQIIGNRVVDELLPERKIVVEINGDYWHANPNKYKPDDLIRIPGGQYTAQEKWDRDARKLAYLKQLGYQVFVIWESDDMEQWKRVLSNI